MIDPVRIDLDDLTEADALPDPDAAGLIPTEQLDDLTAAELLERVIREILRP